MNDEQLREQILDLFREVSSESFYLGVDSEARSTGRGPFGDEYLNVFVDVVVAVVSKKDQTKVEEREKH